MRTAAIALAMLVIGCAAARLGFVLGYDRGKVAVLVPSKCEQQFDRMDALAQRCLDELGKCVARNAPLP